MPFAMKEMYQFMVHFVIPAPVPHGFYELMPFQDKVVEQYLFDGKLLNYALSMDNDRLWAVFNARSEMEVREMLLDFPLTEFMEIEVSLLSAFHIQDQEAAGFSLN